MNLNQEFIGLEAEVIDSKNKSLIGVKGKIVDETKETFKIEAKNKIIIIIKKMATLKINNEKFNGIDLVGRTEERLKNG